MIIIVNAKFSILHVGQSQKKNALTSKSIDARRFNCNKYFEQESTYLNPYDVLAKKNILLNGRTITNS